jgi:hypothetical protein
MHQGITRSDAVGGVVHCTAKVEEYLPGVSGMSSKYRDWTPAGNVRIPLAEQRLSKLAKNIFKISSSSMHKVFRV